MSHHRILIAGAPASGKRWLAARIESLTGIPVVADPPPDAPGEGSGAGGSDALRAAHEWIALAAEPARTAALAVRADLVVLLRTPLWLRDVRLVMRRLLALRRREGPGLGAALASSHRWERDGLSALRLALAPHADKVMECASSEDVRTVLERIFGIDSTAAEAAARR